MVGAGRNPQLCGERFGLFGLEPGGLEVTGGGERVKGGREQGIYSGGRAWQDGAIRASFARSTAFPLAGVTCRRLERRPPRRRRRPPHTPERSRALRPLPVCEIARSTHSPARGGRYRAELLVHPAARAVSGPFQPEGAAGRPDYRLLPAPVREWWERCERDFSAWLRAQDGGDGESSDS